MLSQRWRVRLTNILLLGYGLFSVSCVDATLSSYVPDLLEADGIQIKDDWAGFGWIEAHYSLQRHQQGFKGTAHWRANLRGRIPEAANEDVEIPLDVAQSFLKTLARTSLREGKYKPKIDHTDDYPSISIEFEVKEEIVKIFTESQGEGNIPWGVTIRGKTFVVGSDIPARALKELEPYLKRTVLQKLLEQK